MKIALRLITVLGLFVSGAAAQVPASAQPQERPYVVLVSIDGFRYDYADRFKPPHILAIRDQGASAKSLIPPFPSLTFPSHTSIITGLYPEHHGIVDNSFHDPKRNADFVFTQTGNQGFWYGGTPLWNLAEQQGVRAATYFWPGSDASIGGMRATYWFPYDGKTPNNRRIAQLLDWLRLPAAVRPHFLTLYLSDVDHAGHQFGPDAPETRKAAEEVDGVIGELWEGLQSLHLPVNLILVSDHGMQASNKEWVFLRKFADLSHVTISGGPAGTQRLIFGSPEETEKVYQSLKGKSPLFDVYRRNETPAAWHYRDNDRIGDLVVIARSPVSLWTGIEAPGASGRGSSEPSAGAHGYDPQQFQTMHGIFYAIGPNIKPGARLDSFENVNVYPFIARILRLKLPAKIDGSPKVLDSIYVP